MRPALLAKLVAVAVGTAVVIALPFVVSQFRAVQLATVAVYFIAIVGLDILTGYSGQISLGHGALMAVGGYTTGILMAHHGWTDLVTIPVAALVGGAVVGSMLLGVLVNLIGTYVDWVGTELRLPVALAVILGVLLVKPSGLFGRAAVSRV